MPIILALAGIAIADGGGQAAAPSDPAATPQANAAGSVVVTGNRTASEASIDRRTYPVASDLQAAAGSIADVLRNIPSVQVDLQGNVSLRGSARVTVLVDGKPSPQFSGDSLAQVLLTLPASQIDRIEVMANPSAEFGAEGSGGIINLIMKQAKGPGKTGSLRVQGATDSRAMISGNYSATAGKLGTNADFSFRRNTQISVTDNAQSKPDATTGTIDDNRDLFRAHLHQETANAHGKIDYDLTPKTRLSGGASFRYFHGNQPSTDRFEQSGAAGTPVSAFVRNTAQQAAQYDGGLSATLKQTWARGHDLTLTGTYDLTRFVRHRFDLTMPVVPTGLDGTASFDRHTRYGQGEFKADYEMPMPGKARLKLGYGFDSSRTVFRHDAAAGGPDGRAAPDPAQTGNFLDDESHHAAYATYERPIGKLDAQIGLRAEALRLALDERTHNARSMRHYDRLYPSLHLSYELSAGHTLTASYARRVDRPSYAQLDPVPYPQNPGFVFVGNSALKPQDTDSLEFGYEVRKDAFDLQATAYYRQTHCAFSSLYTLLPGGTLSQQAVNAGDQRNGGLELVLADKLTRTLTYNLSADAYWTELAAPNLGFAQQRRALTGFGRANLNWQLAKKDFLQFNVFVNGETLLPQGRVKPYASGNIGYRHTINARLSWMLVIQDPFASARTRQVLNGFGGTDRRLDTGNNRQASLTLVWGFSGKRQNTDFDFKSGGYGATSAP